MERFKIPVAASLLLLRDSKILLSKRFNTGWEDGKYGFMSGHIDGNESFRATICREAREELGIVLHEDDVHFAHLQHHISNAEYGYLFFTAAKWEGEPANQEPDKCGGIQWFPLNTLPPNLVVGTAEIIEFYRSKVYYSETGFDLKK
ncbi:MAG TPA: NUDIX domain-containing protein [Patescibacteria group bacterium]|nr:NUDIX domain-containing protein [Patescibacteria group bacterium]